MILSMVMGVHNSYTNTGSGSILNLATGLFMVVNDKIVVN